MIYILHILDCISLIVSETKAKLLDSDFKKQTTVKGRTYIVYQSEYLHEYDKWDFGTFCKCVINLCGIINLLLLLLQNVYIYHTSHGQFFLNIAEHLISLMTKVMNHQLKVAVWSSLEVRR